MTWVTYLNGQVFWLVLLVGSFPLVGTSTALGFYETSRFRLDAAQIELGRVVAGVWERRKAQLQ